MSLPVLLDLGHGGTARSGKSTPDGVRFGDGRVEKQVNFDLARRVAQRLGGVPLTRAEHENRTCRGESRRRAIIAPARSFRCTQTTEGGTRARSGCTGLHRHSHCGSQTRCSRADLDVVAGALARGVRSHLASTGQTSEPTNFTDLPEAPEAAVPGSFEELLHKVQAGATVLGCVGILAELAPETVAAVVTAGELLEGHEQFVTQLFRSAYRDGDRRHREIWSLDWPQMRVESVGP